MQQSENAPLAGRVAVVTGASRGIGAAIARRLTRAGACVVIDYVSNDERARQCAQRIMDDCDAAGRVITCKADVTDAEQVRGMVSTTVTTFGGLDILVNNAFAHYSFDPRNRKTFGSIGWSDYAAQLEGCLKGAYNTCEAVLPQMRRQAGGRIINISSNLVDSPIVPYHDYTAAKGALVGFTRSLAQEAGLGRDRERHRGRTDRGHRFESGHHRGHARAHHRLHAAWKARHRRGHRRRRGHARGRRCRVHHGTDPACRRRSGDALTCRIRHAAWE